MAELEVTFWTWGILAGVFFALELLVPTTYFLWPGVAAIGTGLITFLFPTLPLEGQLIFFALAALGSVLLWRLYSHKQPNIDNMEHLNRRGMKYVGNTVILTDPITEQVGRIKLEGVYWTVKGPDLPKGAKVKILALNSGIFDIEPL